MAKKRKAKRNSKREVSRRTPKRKSARTPKADTLPGKIKYRPPQGKTRDRPLERIAQGQPREFKP